jgi:hypothetical protein
VKLQSTRFSTSAFKAFHEDFRRVSFCVRWILLFGLALLVPVASAASNSPSEDAGAAAWKLAQSDPVALVRKTAQNELQHSYGHRPHARYLLRKKTRNIDTTKEIVETANGDVARLIAVGGQHLSTSREQMELRRLHTLAAHPEMEKHRHTSESHDAARVTSILRLLPDAFLYRNGGMVHTSNGIAIRLTFSPNPRFTPPSMESRMMTGIRGEIWIDPADLRIVRMQGHIFRDVDFGWGILGTIYPGGTMRIEQTKTADSGWRLTRLDLNLQGKELLFKSLNIVLAETAWDYHPVPDNWKYTDATRWLLQMPAIPADQLK